MVNSILTDVKKMLMLGEDYTPFDGQLVMHINETLSALMQLGVGPDTGFAITGAAETWDDFIPGATNLESIKTLCAYKTKMIFDPPTTGYNVTALKQRIDELEFRILVEAETPASAEEGG